MDRETTTVELLNYANMLDKYDQLKYDRRRYKEQLQILTPNYPLINTSAWGRKSSRFNGYMTPLLWICIWTIPFILLYTLFVLSDTVFTSTISGIVYDICGIIILVATWLGVHEFRKWIDKKGINRVEKHDEKYIELKERADREYEITKDNLTDNLNTTKSNTEDLMGKITEFRKTGIGLKLPEYMNAEDIFKIAQLYRNSDDDLETCVLTYKYKY